MHRLRQRNRTSTPSADLVHVWCKKVLQCMRTRAEAGMKWWLTKIERDRRAESSFEYAESNATDNKTSHVKCGSLMSYGENGP